jgi:hypothetical protein
LSIDNKEELSLVQNSFVFFMFYPLTIAQMRTKGTEMTAVIISYISPMEKAVFMGVIIRLISIPAPKKPLQRTKRQSVKMIPIPTAAFLRSCSLGARERMILPTR